jgi:hypothetical protein
VAGVALIVAGAALIEAGAALIGAEVVEAGLEGHHEEHPEEVPLRRAALRTQGSTLKSRFLSRTYRATSRSQRSASSSQLSERSRSGLPDGIMSIPNGSVCSFGKVTFGKTYFFSLAYQITFSTSRS